MESQNDAGVQTVQAPQAARKGRKWPVFALLGILIAVPSWYLFVLLPRIRVAAYHAVIEDSNAQGRVAFLDENGKDALGTASRALDGTSVEAIPASEVRMPDRAKKDPGTASIVVKKLTWTGGNTYEVESAMNWGPDVGSGGTFVFQVSLFGCELLEVKDRWTKGEMIIPPSDVPKQKVMPKLQAANPGG